MRQGAPLGLPQVVDGGPGGGGGQGLVGDAEALQRDHRELVPEYPRRGLLGEGQVRAPVHGCADPLTKERPEPGILEKVGGQDDLRGRQPLQLGQEHLIGAVALVGSIQLGDDEVARGPVHGGQAVPVALADDGHQPVIGLIVEERGVQDGPGGDHADDLPLDQALGLGRVLHLLTDGHTISLLDEPGQVAVDGMVWHAAHGDAGLALGGGAGREHHVHLPRRHLGVLAEHLVKITHAEHDERIGMLLLGRVVLLHHGCESGQRSPTCATRNGRLARKGLPPRRRPATASRNLLPSHAHRARRGGERRWSRT